MKSVYWISLKIYFYSNKFDKRKQLIHSIMIQYFHLFFNYLFEKARVRTIFLFDVIGKITRDVEHVFMLTQHKEKIKNKKRGKLYI